MKCISLWQPWATLWLLSDPDEKVFETRGWYTGYRGRLLVHAAKKQDREIVSAVYDDALIAALIRHGIHGMADLSFGALIGEVRLVGCCRTEQVPNPSDREREAGDWEPGRFAWERAAQPRRFERAIPYRGSQGFFEVPDSALVALTLSEER